MVHLQGGVPGPAGHPVGLEPPPQGEPYEFPEHPYEFPEHLYEFSGAPIRVSRAPIRVFWSTPTSFLPIPGTGGRRSVKAPVARRATVKPRGPLGVLPSGNSRARASTGLYRASWRPRPNSFPSTHTGFLEHPYEFSEHPWDAAAEFGMRLPSLRRDCWIRDAAAEFGTRLLNSGRSCCIRDTAAEFVALLLHSGCDWLLNSGCGC